MITALLPVKVFHRSKERLAEFLTPEERERLARTMFDDVWDTLQQALAMPGGIERLLVATAEPYVVNRCREMGVPFLEEREQLSHSASVKTATEWAAAQGATTLLSVPIDTPSVTIAEILALLEAGERYPVVIVPSADGTGTNALLRTPPAAIDPHFGPGSCRRHAENAERNELPHLVLPSPGFAADIDTPQDLQFFAQIDRPCRTRALVREFLAVDRGATACR